MGNVLVTFLLLINMSHADIKSYEKAKLDLISHLEDLVNIQECRKDIQSKNVPDNVLPRSCNKIRYISKYFYTKRDGPAINSYLSQEEIRLSVESRKIIEKYKIKSLGKMLLSDRCVIHNRPIDLDPYLSKIRNDESNIAIFPDDNDRDLATKPEATPKD